MGFGNTTDTLYSLPDAPLQILALTNCILCFYPKYLRQRHKVYISPENVQSKGKVGQATKFQV